MKRAWQKTAKAAMYGTSVDIHKVVEEDEMIGAMHERAERFDERTEHVFGYLQVFSAICVIFGARLGGGAATSHGSLGLAGCAEDSPALVKQPFRGDCSPVPCYPAPSACPPALAPISPTPSPAPSPSLPPQPTARARSATWRAPCRPFTTST